MIVLQSTSAAHAQAAHGTISEKVVELRAEKNRRKIIAIASDIERSVSAVQEVMEENGDRLKARGLRTNLVRIKNSACNLRDAAERREASLSTVRSVAEFIDRSLASVASELSMVQTITESSDAAISESADSALDSIQAVFKNGRVTFERVGDENLMAALEDVRDDYKLPSHLSSLYVIASAPIVPMFKNSAFSFQNELKALRISALYLSTYPILLNQAVLCLSRKKAATMFEAVKPKLASAQAAPIFVPPLIESALSQLGLDLSAIDTSAALSKALRGLARLKPESENFDSFCIDHGLPAIPAENRARVVKMVAALVKQSKPQAEPGLKGLDRDTSPEVALATEAVARINERSTIKYALVSETFYPNPANPDIALFWLMPSSKVSKMLDKPGMQVKQWALP